MAESLARTTDQAYGELTTKLFLYIQLLRKGREFIILPPKNLLVVVASVWSTIFYPVMFDGGGSEYVMGRGFWKLGSKKQFIQASQMINTHEKQNIFWFAFHSHK